MTSRTKLWALSAGALAMSLALAGCGGGGSSSSSVTTPTGGGGGGGQQQEEEATPTNMVDLNGLDHGLMEAADYDVAAGTTYKVAGVRFYCPTGGDDCTVSVAVDDEGAVTVTYDEAGGTPTAMALSAVGYQSFDNLSDALLDADDRTELMSMLYDEDVTPAVVDDPDTTEDETMAEVINGGGVTSSLTTHEQPITQGDANTVTGVSDLFVSIAPTVDPASADHASEEVDRVALAADFVTENLQADPPVQGVEDGDRVTQKIDNPVLVDDEGMIISDRTASFSATASWVFNPAEDWVSALTGMEPEDPLVGGIWTYVLDTDDGMTLPGGRTLHLELRSDFNPNATANGTPIVVARGPADDGSLELMRVKVEDVSFDDLEIASGTEMDIPEDGVMGSYQGVRGLFTCVSAGTDEADICRVNQHTDKYLTPSESSDTLMFTPLVYTPDSDWLSAGVWITVPDDPEGDYSIGGFAFGNDQYKPANLDAAQDITGTASYNGQAFGYFAEETDGPDGFKEVGNFTADAALTANFGADGDSGSISGELNSFVANHQSVDWDVNFESAMLKLGRQGTGDTDGNGQIDGGESAFTYDAPDTALRFDAGASGHANGHGLTGYWNGQFYGSPAALAEGDDLQPGSVAGTFGLTTERDPDDSYSLTLGGAFGAHKEAAEDSN